MEVLDLLDEDDTHFESQQHMDENDKALVGYLKEPRQMKFGEAERKFRFWDDDSQHAGTIRQVEQMFYDWVEHIVNPTIKNTSPCKFVNFGSRMIGGSVGFDFDVDAVCLVSLDVPSDWFFTDFAEILQEKEEIRDLVKIEAARAPIISFTLNSVSFDLSLARLENDQIEKFPDICVSDEFFKTLDLQSQISLSGYFTNLTVMNAVPDK